VDKSRSVPDREGTFQRKESMSEAEKSGLGTIETPDLGAWIRETRIRLEAPSPPVESQTESRRPSRTLLGSMIFQPALNKKRSIRFLSVRRWRASTKERDLDLLKEAKELCEEPFIRDVAREIAEVAWELVQNVQGMRVTNPPPGATEPGRKHFATELAREVARILEMEHVDTFSPRPRGSASHPGHYDNRGDLVFAAKPPCGPYLLLDDVATSGTTLEECARELKRFGMVLPIVWVYEVKQS
jgi:hypothetical protein